MSSNVVSLCSPLVFLLSYSFCYRTVFLLDFHLAGRMYLYFRIGSLVLFIFGIVVEHGNLRFPINYCVCIILFSYLAFNESTWTIILFLSYTCGMKQYIRKSPSFC